MAKAGSRGSGLTGWSLVILGILTGTAALSLDMYLPAFPTIATDFAVPASDVQLTMNVFLIGLAAGQLVYGPLSDRFGRRPVILGALAVYGGASAYCALAPGVDGLIWARLIQGLAAAGGSILGRAMIRDVFAGPRLLRAMSTLMLVLTAAPMIAPLIGSFVLAFWGWRAIFWILCLYALAWIGLVCLYIPETLSPRRRISLQFGKLTRLFAEIVMHRQAMGYGLCAGFGFAGMFAYIAATPFIYMVHFGVSPTAYSLFFAANVTGMALSTTVNRHLAGRMSGYGLLTLFTTVLLCASALLIVTSMIRIGGVWGMAVPLFFFVGSLSAIAASAISGTLHYFGHAAGTASSVFGVLQFGLGSIGGWIISLIGGGQPESLAWFMAACAVLSALALHGMVRSGFGRADVI